jgi:hypothetical protein
LVVDFRQPRTLVMLWFELHFGTNSPLGILIVATHLGKYRTIASINPL